MVFYLNDSMKRKVSITNPDKNETNGSRTAALLESFCRTTTAHGFQCYIRSESRICHYVWLVITITGFVAIGIHLSLVTAAYLRYPYLESSKLSPKRPMFPFITLCNLIGVSYDNLVKQKRNPQSKYNTVYLKMYEDVSRSLKWRVASNNISALERWIIEDALDSQQIMFANLGKEAMQVGYSLDDLILNCTHDRGFCKSEDFEIFHHPDYFNCYTYKGGAKYLDSMLSGPEHGISLILYSEVMDLLQGFVQLPYENMNPIVNSLGVRLVIHGEGTFPNIDSQGIDIFPGVSTSIALKMTESIHLDKPYSDCYTPEDDPSNNLTYKTDLNSCRKICKDKIIYERCGCAVLDSVTYTKDEDTRFCMVYNGSNVEQVINDILCYENIQKNLSRLIEQECTCYWLCTEYNYESIISQSYWPRNDVLASFIEMFINVPGKNSSAKNTYDFLSRIKPVVENSVSEVNEYYNDTQDVHIKTLDNNLTAKDNDESHNAVESENGTHEIRYETSSGEKYVVHFTEQDKVYYEEMRKADMACNMGLPFPLDLAMRWRQQSFFRLNVYFRDVVVIENSQYPKTEWPDLFSDTGGILGLWAGLSIMSVIEFIFLMFNIIASLLANLSQ